MRHDEDDLLSWGLSQSGVTTRRLLDCRPDFLVISPPKTGSTWLADNFRRHPQLFVPAIKEVKYFSTFFKALDLGWYLDHFADAGGRTKGEAAPSYALLPRGRIRLVRRLMPRVKLIFLMRDPVARAWSHARHGYRFREGIFAGATSSLAEVSDEQWLRHLSGDWSLASGDYLGQLRRWLAVFPREQVYLGFTEWLEDRPEALLREVFAFLGVDDAIDLSGFPVRERVLAGLPGEPPPAVEQALRRLLHERTVELAAVLRDEYGLTPPWPSTSGPTPAGPPPPPAAGARADEAALAAILAEEETFPSARCTARPDYRGYYIVYAQGQFHALAAALAPLRPGDIDESVLRGHAETGDYFVAPSLEAAQERVDEHLAALAEARLRDASRRIAALERGLAALQAALQGGDAPGSVALERGLAEATRLRGLTALCHRLWGRLPQRRLLTSPASLLLHHSSAHTATAKVGQPRGGMTVFRILTAAPWLPALLFAALLLAADTSPALAQPPVRPGDDISGDYINRSNRGRCQVEARGRNFVFVNENGTRARFVYTSRSRLEMVSGDWAPGVVVTVQRDRFGQPVLRFDSPDGAPGYWVPAD